MRNLMDKSILLLLGGVLALGMLVFAWGMGSGASEADSAGVTSCPQAGKWAISVWGGDDATDTGQALATCDASGVDAAYYIDPETQVWSRWFAGRSDISNLSSVNNMQGFLALGGATAAPPTLTATAAPTATPTTTPTPSVDVGLSQQCYDSWTAAEALETIIYLSGQEGLPTAYWEGLLATEDDFIQGNCSSPSVAPVQDPTSDMQTLCADAVVTAGVLAGLIAVAELEDVPHTYLSQHLGQVNAFIQANCL